VQTPTMRCPSLADAPDQMLEQEADLKIGLVAQQRLHLLMLLVVHFHASVRQASIAGGRMLAAAMLWTPQPKRYHETERMPVRC
jgi:hypothetical protein